MRRLSAVVTLSSLWSVLLTSGCLLGRPNKQIDKIEYGKDQSGEVSFKYDDDGFPTEIERDYGSGVEPTVWQLEWEDALLVEGEIDDGSADPTTFEVEYDDGNRPEVYKLRGPTFDGEIEFEYDDQGRLTGYRTETTSDGEVVSELEAEIKYADGGAIEEVITTSTFGESSTESVIEYEFDGARLQKSTQTFDDDQETETEYDYDDSGRLAGAKAVRTLETGDRISSTELEVEFGDDGFIESWSEITDYQSGGESYEVEGEISYNDEDARGLDMAPGFLTIFFDLRGGSYHSLVDARTQVSRFLVTAW